MRSYIGWLGFCLAGALSASAWARPYVLQVRSNQCGSETDLRARVQRRCTRTKPENWQFAVNVISSPEGIIATVTSVSPRGATETRRVQGAQCDSVLDAAALVIAVTLDPSLVTSESEVVPPSPARARGTQPSGPRTSWQVGARVGGGVRNAMADSVGWELSAGAVLLRQSRYSSELGLEYVRARGKIPSASLTLQAGRLGLAPVRLKLNPSLFLTPAADLELGWLRGRADDDLVGGRSRGGLWVSVGLRPTLTLLAGGEAPGGLAVALTPFLALPLKTDTFEAGDTELHEVPWWEVGTSVAATLWLG